MGESAFLVVGAPLQKHPKKRPAAEGNSRSFQPVHNFAVISLIYNRSKRNSSYIHLASIYRHVWPTAPGFTSQKSSLTFATSVVALPRISLVPSLILANCFKVCRSLRLGFSVGSYGVRRQDVARTLGPLFQQLKKFVVILNLTCDRLKLHPPVQPLN